MSLISGLWRNRDSHALDRDSFLGLHFYPIWEAASLYESLYNGGLLQGYVLRLADQVGFLRRRSLQYLVALVFWIAHRSVVSLLSHGFTGCFCNGHRIVGIRRVGPYCMVARPTGRPLNVLNRERNLPVAVQSRLSNS